MTGAPWLEIAVRELIAGVAERPGADHNLRIVEYHRATSLGATDDETPWCAAFVNWCLRAAWVPGTRSAAARSFLPWGAEVPKTKPRVGSIVVLWRGAPTGASGHVGFYLGSDPGNVLLLGGNQGNRVSVAAFSWNRVLSLRWPG